jgi:hypothetical protein
MSRLLNVIAFLEGKPFYSILHAYGSNPEIKKHRTKDDALFHIEIYSDRHRDQ